MGARAAEFDIFAAAMANSYRVLLTGFGVSPLAILDFQSQMFGCSQPFSVYSENPSWLAVEPLHNTVIPIEPSSSAIKRCSQIHITTLKIPVVYQSVLEIIPGLHERPPTMPDAENCIPPPEEGFDFVFHVGVAGNGPLQLEEVAHKVGYDLKDASQQLAPIVPSSQGPVPAEAEGMGRARLSKKSKKSFDTHRIRGFGKGYEDFPEELSTSLNLQTLMQCVKLSGTEVIDGFYSQQLSTNHVQYLLQQVCISQDAGRYLCDFIYYCSLAEAKRHASADDKRTNTQVLFLHCPPVNKPLSTKEVTKAIKRIIVWVCTKQ